MDYTLLRAFHAVGLERSFSQAARRLNVSQSTLSTQVKNLEARFGVELFHRHARGATLTDAGERLLGTTLRMFAHERDAYELLSAMAGLRTGHLAISAVGPYQLSEILLGLSLAYPNLNISVSFGNSEQAQQKLLDYESDVAVLGSYAPHPELHAIEYSRPRIVVAASRQHRWAGRGGVRIEELRDESFIRREIGSETRRAFEEALERAGVQVVCKMEIGSREGMLAAVAQGIGIGVVSEEEAIPNPELQILNILDMDISTSVHVACLASRSESHLIKPFLQVVQTLIEQRRSASDITESEATAGGRALSRPPISASGDPTRSELPRSHSGQKSG
ncbi:MAG: LysR family transcriptional regulator [Hyphomicrobiaceae bacterium]|nr:LysR family transcriptional regulator [Hyphomicrobiaceae bacterium]